MKERDDYLSAMLQTPKDFAGVPIIGAFLDGKYYFTAQKITWTADGDYADKYTNVDVPKGFVTDLTSIPRPFWAMMPRDGPYLAAAIIHDYNYWLQDRSRKVSDQIFNIGMKELNVARVKRKIIYEAVKWAGGHSWRQNAALKDAGEIRLIKKFPETPITWEMWKTNPGEE